LLVRLGNSMVALWAERAWPAFRHRLISAVELNRPNAPTAGMSPSLIAQVTREAEAEVARADLRQAVDHSRYWKSGAVLAPVLLGALVVLLVMPNTALALLKRQFFGNAEIPRSVYLENVTEDIWPSNEPGTIKIAAEGYGVRDDLVGKVIVRTSGDSRADLPLIYSAEETAKLREKEKQTRGTPTGRKVFVAQVTAGSADFTFRAWLRDGRLRSDGKVTYEPRPDVAKIDALVSMPGGYARRPWHPGLRWWQPGPLFTEPQDGNKIRAYPDAPIRLQVTFTRPVRWAVLELLGPSDDGKNVHGTVVRRIERQVDPLATGVSFEFEMAESLTGFRFAMQDFRGFNNGHQNPRPLELRKVERPHVTLLAEVYRPPGVITGSIEEYVQANTPWNYEADGLLIAYHVTSDLPLDRAWLRYRVVRGDEAVQLPSNEKEEEQWLSWPPRVRPQDPPLPGELTLLEYNTDRQNPPFWFDSRINYEHPQGDPSVGPFIFEEGVFARTPNGQRNDFHAVPSDNPEESPGRLYGGGRIHLPVTKLSRPVRRESGWREDETSRFEVGLRPGDRLVYYVEVSNRQSPPLIGRSALRETRIVSLSELLALDKKNQELDKRLADWQKEQERLYNRSLNPFTAGAQR
jgi:hypothetical protein